MGRDAADATAFGTCDRTYILNTVAPTTGADGFDTVADWVRSACAVLGPDAVSYVNFTGEASQEHVRASYPAATYERLASVRCRYDPTKLFRLPKLCQPAVPHKVRPGGRSTPTPATKETATAVLRAPSTGRGELDAVVGQAVTDRRGRSRLLLAEQAQKWEVWLPRSG